MHGAVCNQFAYAHRVIGVDNLISKTLIEYSNCRRTRREFMPAIKVLFALGFMMV